jgi:hypothetical protein
MQSYNPNTKYEILTPNGWEDFEGVFKNEDVWARSRRIMFENGVALTATLDHVFYCHATGRELKCHEINTGDRLKTHDTKGWKVANIEEIVLQSTYDVFNAKNHVILVDGGVLSHQCDEFAFLQPSLARGFWTSLSPTLSTGGKILVTSTPSSDEDQFAEIWFGANRTIDANGNETDVGENGFKAYMATWSRHPDRDEAWAAAERASIGEDRFLREHECVAKDTEISLCDESGREFSMTVQHLFDSLKCQSQTQQHMGNSHNDNVLHSEVKTTPISP